MTTPCEDPSVKESHFKDSFAPVFVEELKLVLKRREDLEPELQPPKDAIEEEKVYHQALNRDLCGLAISGGGIRSATFALGVLQGLASAGLLRKFDYLSTVSGGGYIGSWLSAWIHRDGLDEVMARLPPPAVMGRLPPATATTNRQETPDPRRRTTEIEPRPIRHLRLYSNFLTPRPGLFSFDGWTLIAIYLRNLLLNQLVLFLAVIACFAVVRFLVELFVIAHDSGVSSLLVVPLGALFVLSSFVHAWGVACYAPQGALRGARDSRSRRVLCGLRTMLRADRPGTSCSRNTSDCFHLGVFWLTTIIPLCIASLSLALVITQLLIGVDSPLNHLDGWLLVSAGFAIGTFLPLVSGHSPKNAICWRLLVQGAMASAAALGIFVSLMIVVQTLVQMTDLYVAVASTLLIPSHLLCYVLATFFMTGLRGYRSDDQEKSCEIQREWWSQVAARLFIIALGWLAIVGAIVFGPWGIVQLAEWSSFAAGSLSLGWLATLVSGVLAARSPTTKTSADRGVLPLLAKIAPPLFFVTLLLLCSTLCTWIMYDLHAWIVGHYPEYQFMNQLDELPKDLNDSQMNLGKAPQGEPGLLGSGLAFVDHPPVSIGWLGLLVAAFAAFLGAKSLGKRLGPNVFSLQRLYRNRLVSCYLGASTEKRTPEPLVNLSSQDDLELAELLKLPDGREPGDTGPFHIINGALNQKASSIHHGRAVESPEDTPDSRAERIAENLQFLERQSESFIFTPLYSGSVSTGYRRTSSYSGSIKIGEAIAVSGAAASPNMGYHSSPSITALLTVFNVRLGGWFPNPRLDPNSTRATTPDPLILLKELAGMTDSSRDSVYVSDGGHFENMGVYELIRRRCRFILAIDAGGDPDFHENVGRVVRQVRIDFGIWIDIDISPASPGPDGRAKSHVVVGRIHYGNVDKESVAPTVASADGATTASHHEHSGPTVYDLSDPRYLYERNQGIVIWLKNSLTGDEPGDLVNHAAMNPAFPYDTIADQFFDEIQFESYRALGIHTVFSSLRMPTAASHCNDQSIVVGSTQSMAEFIADGAVRTRAAANSPADVPATLAASYRQELRNFFETNYCYWLAKPPQVVPQYVDQNEQYAQIQQTLRTDPTLRRLAKELYGQTTSSNTAPTLDERLMINQMLTVLENVWLILDLDKNPLHPLYAGWMAVFKNWISSPLVKSSWYGRPEQSGCPLRDEYSPAFRQFVENQIESGRATRVP